MGDTEQADRGVHTVEVLDGQQVVCDGVVVTVCCDRVQVTVDVLGDEVVSHG